MRSRVKPLFESKGIQYTSQQIRKPLELIGAVYSMGGRETDMMMP